jgi:hypothetical protein
MKFNLCMNVMALLLAVVMVATPVTAATSDPAEPMASALLSDYSASASRPTSGAVKVKYSVTGMTLLDLKPKYGDKILTLSTCEYSIRDPGTNAKNGRLVIMAVRVDCVCDQ